MILNAPLKRLQKNRPVFHSEADLQHELAMAIGRIYPKADIRIGMPLSNRKINVDVYTKVHEMRYGIELKYKTKKSIGVYDHEYFDLKAHAAQNLGRYDFLHDIERLEMLKRSKVIDKGFAIMLSNDRAYWNPESTSKLSRDFFIHDGARIKKTLKWNEGVKESTIRKFRNRTIRLRGDYDPKWVDYSEFNGEPFRILIIEV